MMKRMVLTGIAGGIGSGKSYVSRILRSLGFEVYDCDERARAIMDSDEKLKRRIAQTLGDDCLLADGSLCRPRIAEIVFAHAEARSRLNALVHNEVRNDVLHFVADYSGSKKQLFVESAILASSGLASLCDNAWLVTAPLPLRIERICKRSALTPEQASARIDAQRDEEVFLRNIFDIDALIEIVNSETTPILSEIIALTKTKN